MTLVTKVAELYESEVNPVLDRLRDIGKTVVQSGDLKTADLFLEELNNIADVYATKFLSADSKPILVAEERRRVLDAVSKYPVGQEISRTNLERDTGLTVRRISVYLAFLSRHHVLETLGRGGVYLKKRDIPLELYNAGQKQGQ